MKSLSRRSNTKYHVKLGGGGFRARLRSYNYLCHYYIYLHKADDAKQEVEAW